MQCLPFCGGTRLSKFEQKANPVLRKFESLQDDYTTKANAHNEQYRASKKSALEYYARGEEVLAYARALDALRHQRQCKRLMNFVRQIGDSISKIDSVWASHAVIEGFAEISHDLSALAPTEEGEMDDVREDIDVAQRLHVDFDSLMQVLQSEVQKIDILDETGVQLDDDEIERTIQNWQDPHFQEVSQAEAFSPETLLMQADEE
jgi:hypothetical protein